jgi:hypothetical protein
LPSARDASFYASSLLELHKVAGPAERRAAWRQSMTALGQAPAEEGPGPLEGLDRDALTAGVRAALEDGLVDDLDWLGSAPAGSALYELASALPVGPEQRELGRRVLARIVSADAVTFVAIAQRMALGVGKGFATPGVRARVSLVAELPLSLGVNDGPLALAIVSRRDLAREWIALPSTGSLPSRRLAARLIERAAYEAARRASQGDDYSIRTFRSEAVAPAWDRLLADRESLVWRHVANARGLLAPWARGTASEIERALAPNLSATEWRRAAASIAAQVAVAPTEAIELARRAISQGLLDRDPGAASGFVWGVARAAAFEEESAKELLDLVFAKAGSDIGEAVLDLRADLGKSPLADHAAKRALALLSTRKRHAGDDGAEALALQVTRDLEGASRGDEPVRDHIAAALAEFHRRGAKEAYARARHALNAAQGSLDTLKGIRVEDDGAPDGSLARWTSLAVLRDLDLSILEREVLGQLLSLGGGTEGARTAEEALDAIRDHLAEWLLLRDGRPTPVKVSSDPPHLTLQLRRLRALLHLADSDVGDDEQDARRAARLRTRVIRIARALLDRFEHGPASPLRRTVVAGLARALDAMVRVGVCDKVDAFLVVVRGVADAREIETVAEASMDPDLVRSLGSYARFAAVVAGDINLAKARAAFETLTNEVDADSSGHAQQLRSVLVRLSGAMAGIASATSLRGLVGQGGEPEVVTALENALGSLAQLAMGARARLEPERARTAPPQTADRLLSIAVSRALAGTSSRLSIGGPKGAAQGLDQHLVSASLDSLLAGVPKAIGRLVTAVVWRLTELPLEGSAVADAPPPSRVLDPLPSWLPPRRSIGGFHVARSLSAGALGSVFVAMRADEKDDPDAEKFALKVPEYSASAARQLSEAEFMKMFREEAGALIALPHHPNLARFVTFDAGSRPKPILVMELVEGVTLERLVHTKGLDVKKGLALLDDVLKGLEAMHSIGVGHLDIKPSNVVMRKGQEAVLVDFGLSGRHIRPGCATGPYGAPEVWGALESKDPYPSPAKADIYAFGCVAYETLTGKQLFDGETELALVAKHVSHDGMPPPVKALSSKAVSSALAQFLSKTLRRMPHDRPTAADARKELGRLAPELAKAKWPLEST